VLKRSYTDQNFGNRVRQLNTSMLRTIAAPQNTVATANYGTNLPSTASPTPPPPSAHPAAVHHTTQPVARVAPNVTQMVTTQGMPPTAHVTYANNPYYTNPMYNSWNANNTAYSATTNMFNYHQPPKPENYYQQSSMYGSMPTLNNLNGHATSASNSYATYRPQPQATTAQQPRPPQRADVKFTELPFFDLVHTLLPPCALSNLDSL